MLNIAYFAADQLFILASAEASLLATLDAITAGATLDKVDAATAVAAQLSTAAAALLQADGCVQLRETVGANVPPEIVAALQASLDQASHAHRFDYAGFGYVNAPEPNATARDAAPLPLGLFVYHYADHADAEADLAVRHALATGGVSPITLVPYADMFEVVDTSVVARDDGANLILRLHARERSPQLFLDMLFRRDVLFSACGG